MTNAFLHGYQAGYMSKQGQEEAFVKPSDQAQADADAAGIAESMKGDAGDIANDHRANAIPAAKSILDTVAKEVQPAEKKVLDFADKATSYLAPSAKSALDAIKNTQIGTKLREKLNPVKPVPAAAAVAPVK